MTITDSQAGAVIYYTRDGTTPTNTSPQYAGPFTVNATEPVQAIAVAPGNAPSVEVSSVYTIDTTLTSLAAFGGDFLTGYSCAAIGPMLPSGTGPTGTMTLTDTTTNQILGTSAVGAPAITRVFDQRTLNFLPDIPTSTIAADVNGDGKLDLVISNAGEIAVLLGNGDGTFQPQVSVAGTSGPGSVVVGDFNGDGKPDLVYTIEGTGSFAFVPGNGDGTFGAPQLHSAGTALSAGVVGDFNGDGKLDLAITNGGDGTTGNTILVLLGNGDGTFQSPVSYTVGNGPVAMIAGVFTTSGKLDLAVSNALDGTVSMLVGNGDGTFQAQIVTQRVNAGQAMAAADFNGDGNLDLAVDSQQGEGSILLGNGDGTFQYQPSLVLYTNNTEAIVAADFSADKIPDLLIGFEDFLIEEEIGNGNGTFDQQPDFAAGPTGPLANEPFDLTTGDFNGDGVPDFVVNEVSPLTGGPVIAFYANDSWATVSASFPTSSFYPTSTSEVLQCSYSGDANYEASTSPPLNNAVQQLSPPVFSLLVGVFNAPQTVSISDTSGGSIYFTTDGSTPTMSSTKYSGPIPISSATTFKAIAAEGGYVTSAVSEASYSFASTPQFSPPAGSYTTGQNVSITDSTPNTAIYYTTDGSTPTTQSNLYTTPIPASGNTTINAFAVASNYLDSVVSSATYSIGLPATTTALQASATSGNPGQTITLTASVIGKNPTGSVAFATNGTPLGTANLSNGIAILQTSFATSGSYPITASYGGDTSNAASVSSVVTIVIATSDFSLQSSPTSQTVTSGQAATFMINVTPTGGYTGTVNFSCSNVPSEASCSFTPSSSETVSGPVTTQLTISTAAAVSSRNARPSTLGEPQSLAKPMLLVFTFGFLFSIRRLRRSSRYFRMMSCIVFAILMGSALTSCGIGSSKSSSGVGNSGTPPGSYSVSVSASGGSQGPSHSLTLTLIVQ